MLLLLLLLLLLLWRHVCSVLCAVMFVCVGERPSLTGASRDACSKTSPGKQTFLHCNGPCSVRFYLVVVSFQGYRPLA
jgi:hypothetical protein